MRTKGLGVGCSNVYCRRVVGGGGVSAQKPPLLPEKDVAALANELSGETAKRNLEVIATFHRQRDRRDFIRRRSWWRRGLESMG